MNPTPHWGSPNGCLIGGRRPVSHPALHLSQRHHGLGMRVRRAIPALGLLLLLAGLTACSGDVTVEEDNIAGTGTAASYIYDDFSGAGFDTNKWFVDTTGGGVASISGGIATLSINTAGADMQSTLQFPDTLAANIGVITARVNTTVYTQLSASNVRFRLFLRAYKDDVYASSPTDLTSDVFAQLRLRDVSGLKFQAMVSRCIDSSCGSAVLQTTDLGIPVLGQTYDVSLGWDGGTVYSFDVSGVGSTTIDSSTVAVPGNKVGSSGQPRAQVEVIASSGAPTTGSATSEVDYVICKRVDGSVC